ncbi:hypothetical protein PIB30_078706, partial [Stylosanthes scabra]|nr:hypothetical protein [Stylosanthes scabra]
MVGLFLQREISAGCKEVTKASGSARCDSIVNSSPCALTPGKEKKSKKETRQNVGIVSVLPYDGHQCSGLVTEKEVLLKCKCSAGLQRRRTSAAKVWNGGVVDLQGHSNAQI